MTEFDSVLMEIRKEATETRNLAIKTDNLVKGLSGDIRNLQKQFEGYNKRTRLFFVIGYVVLSVVLVFSAVWVTVAQTAASQRQLTAKEKELEQSHQEFSRLQDKFAQFRAQSGRDMSAKVGAEELAAEILALIDNRNEYPAVLKARSLDIDQLGPVSRPILEAKLKEARRRQGDLAYQSGRAAYDRKAYPKAAEYFDLALELAPSASVAPLAFYFLAQSLLGVGDKERSLELVNEFLKKYPNHPSADDLLYQKAKACESWQDEGCSNQAYQELIAQFPGSAYASLAKKRIKTSGVIPSPPAKTRSAIETTAATAPRVAGSSPAEAATDSAR